jgi:hypothetical protein
MEQMMRRALHQFRNTIHTETVTNSMELSASWEAASRSATQEFLNTLRKPKVRYRVDESKLIIYH